MNSIKEEPHRTRPRLPHPRWIPVVAILLAVWALALGVWRSSLQSRPQAAPSGVATSAAPRVNPLAAVADQPAAAVEPSAANTPETVPVMRSPSQQVREEDWLALAQAFDTERALADIVELTSAKYAGRAVGSPGSGLAGDWIAARFEEYGLQAAGDDGTYFQEFPVPYAELTAMPTFELLDSAGLVEREFRFRDEYMLWPGGYADGGQVQGPVLWVSDGGHDDYDGLNAVGAIVLSRYTRPFEDIQRQALEHGAKALLLARLDDANLRMRRTARSDALLPQGIPTLVVGREVAEDLIANSGMTIDDLTIEYKSRELGSSARIDLPLEYEQGKTGRNVLGVLPGSDPDGKHQVFIVGAHYDHMGADPDGTMWPGANDDVSGVVVLLEMARLWQERGYTPKRTVLFAAWDGEEIGLNGSEHYVEHPRYPLEDTVGMLQLDMVGAGTPTLAIGPGGLVARQSTAAAAWLGIPVQPESGGGSDHAPFVAAGVPAAIYIWWAGDAPDLVYHVPEDDISNIEPDRLEAAGQLAHLVTLYMSWEQEDLEDLTTRRTEALGAQDINAVLRTVDPWDRDLVSQEESWLTTLISRQAAEFTSTVSSPIIVGNVATSTMTLHYRWQSDDSRTTATVPVRWRRRDLDWYFGGPAWDQSVGQHVRVQHLQAPLVADRLVRDADTLYEFLTDQAGLDLPETVTIAFYSEPGQGSSPSALGAGSQDLLHALSPPPPGFEEAYGWSVDGGILLSRPADLDTLLTEWALQRAGWPSEAASWLGQGLIDYWQVSEASDPQALAEIRQDYMPVLQQALVDNALWTLGEMPGRHEVESRELEIWRAQAWAVTSHLLDTESWTALQAPLTLDDEAWRVALLDPWQRATTGIQVTLAERTRAVLELDKAAFLATVDPADTVLLQEESHWFDDLALHPAETFSYDSRLLSLDGDQATAELTVRYALSEPSSAAGAVTYRARFVQANDLWYYSDVDLSEDRSEHFVLKYEHPDHGLHAPKLLSLAEGAYDQVTTDLGFHPTAPIEIKVYHQTNLFSFSIYMSMPRARGWTEPGESIKIALPASEQLAFDGLGATLAHELTHSALFDKGVQHGAVHEGTAHYEAGLYDSQWLYQKVRNWRREVYDVVRSKRLLTLEDLVNWREVEPDDFDLMYSMGWDTVSYFRERYGRETFLDWLGLLGTDLSFEEAFLQATGMTFADFDSAWRESVLRGHVDPQYIEMALRFDGQHALADVHTLAQLSWAGREAGTSGNQAAAQYVADKFAEYGLRPAGDEGSYFQWFDARQTALARTPTLEILGEDGSSLLSLRYRADFRPLLGGKAGGGQAASTLLYVRNLRAEDLRLGGRVVLAQATANPLDDVADAERRGAGALLLMTSKWPSAMTIKSNDLPLVSSRAIPVYELTKEASDAILDLAGYRSWQLEDVPPAVPLPLSARVDVSLAVTPTVRVPNVLALLPGTDPQVSDQVLIIAAHLDHVGRLPDGTVYPGANNDASGIAVLLEIARLWHSMGYQPRRTVLFAAWNGTELGLLGSKYYVTRPVFSLDMTAAMIQLDMVGQGRGFYIIASSDKTEDARILAHLENAAPRVQGRLSFERDSTSSDHRSFDLRGIPAVMLSWEEPQNTHRPEDTADTVSQDKLGTVGRVTALTLMTMADE